MDKEDEEEYYKECHDFTIKLRSVSVPFLDINNVLLYANLIQRKALQQCNEPGWNDTDIATVAQYERRIEFILKPHSFEFEFHSDPRGNCTKLKHKDIVGNDWGGEGWYGVPTRRY